MPLVDYFIATPLEEEWAAAADVLADTWHEVPLEGSPTYYTSELLLEDSPSYLIAGTPMPSMGQSASAIYTKDLLVWWKPANVILFGIAGTFDNRHELGDVLVPDQIFGYEVASQSDSGRRYRPTGHQANFFLLDRAKALTRDSIAFEKWQEDCVSSAKAMELDLKGPPKVHFAPVASGNDVVKTVAAAELLREQIHPKLAGVEMEASGLFSAIHSSDSGAHVLMVRGISDRADRDKTKLEETSDGLFRAYAAGNAARFVAALLARKPTAPLHECPALAAVSDADATARFMDLGIFIEETGYYHLAFSRCVSFPQGHSRVALEIDARSGEQSLRPLRALVLLHGSGSAVAPEVVALAPGRVLAAATRGILALRRPNETALVLELPRDDTPRRHLEVLLVFDSGTDPDTITFKYLDEFGRTSSDSWRASGG